MNVIIKTFVITFVIIVVFVVFTAIKIIFTDDYVVSTVIIILLKL